MKFRNRRLIKYEDLNPRGSLFGGQLLKWIDEEAAIYAFCQLGTDSVVTKLISEINFVAPVVLGDVIEMGMNMVAIGKTSITFQCEVRNKNTQKTVVKIDKLVFVKVDENGKAVPHGLTEEKE